MTQSCRINGEHHTRFPFHCSLSDLFRAKRVLGGIVTQLGADRALRVNVRERRFLEHDEVPPEIKVRHARRRPCLTCAACESGGTFTTTSS